MGIKNIKGGNLLILVLSVMLIIGLTAIAASIMILRRDFFFKEKLEDREVEINNHIYEVYGNAIVHTKDCYCVEAKRVCGD